jgi:hypothetical protein
MGVPERGRGVRKRTYCPRLSVLLYLLQSKATLNRITFTLYYCNKINARTQNKSKLHKKYIKETK